MSKASENEPKGRNIYSNREVHDKVGPGFDRRFKIGDDRVYMNITYGKVALPNGAVLECNHDQYQTDAGIKYYEHDMDCSVPLYQIVVGQDSKIPLGPISTKRIGGKKAIFGETAKAVIDALQADGISIHKAFQNPHGYYHIYIKGSDIDEKLKPYFSDPDLLDGRNKDQGKPLSRSVLARYLIDKTLPSALSHLKDHPEAVADHIVTAVRDEVNAGREQNLLTSEDVSSVIQNYLKQRARFDPLKDKPAQR